MSPNLDFMNVIIKCLLANKITRKQLTRRTYWKYLPDIVPPSPLSSISTATGNINMSIVVFWCIGVIEKYNPFNSVYPMSHLQIAVSSCPSLSAVAGVSPRKILTHSIILAYVYCTFINICFTVPPLPEWRTLAGNTARRQVQYSDLLQFMYYCH